MIGWLFDNAIKLNTVETKGIRLELPKLGTTAREAVERMMKVRRFPSSQGVPRINPPITDVCLASEILGSSDSSLTENKSPILHP